MNDDKAAEEIKNLFADFKFLASKVNDNNKNRKKKLDETKKILEACKQKYQKLFYEHNALKKKKILRVGTKTENSKSDTEKNKNKILCCESKQLRIRYRK